MKEGIIEKISTLVTGAFGLVAALAWNSAIQAIFAKYYQQPGEGVIGLLLYALFVTIIAVIATIWVGRAAQRAKKREDLLKKHTQILKSIREKIKHK